MADEKIVRVGQASINTVSVEIKSIRVSGKQMTQAVFRQIKSGALVDWDNLALLGTPWGTVNYHGGCEGHKHIHVIWQQREELRKSLIEQGDGVHHSNELFSEDIDNLKRAVVASFACAGRLAMKNDYTTAWAEFNIKGYTFKLHLPYNDPLKSLLALNYEDVPHAELRPTPAEASWRERERTKIQQKFAEQYPLPPDDYTSLLKVAVQSEYDYKSRWEKLYAELESLPQLFIAV